MAYPKEEDKGQYDGSLKDFLYNINLNVGSLPSEEEEEKGEYCGNFNDFLRELGITNVEQASPQSDKAAIPDRRNDCSKMER